jgi:hypothetical protein
MFGEMQIIVFWGDLGDDHRKLFPLNFINSDRVTSKLIKKKGVVSINNKNSHF